MRREYRTVESTRLHRQKKLVQRIFYQTGSQQVGGNKYSSDSSTVRLYVHQKTPGLFAYLPSPAGPKSSSPWKQRKIPSWIGCPENRPEQWVFCLLLLVLTDVSRKNSFTHLCPKDKTGNKGGSHAFASSVSYI